MKAPSFAHANCAICFERTYRQARSTAQRYYDDARGRARDLRRLFSSG